MKTDISQLKQKIRNELKSGREAVSGEDFHNAAMALAGADLSPLELQSGTVVAGYHPVRRECNCLLLLDRLGAMSMTVGLPVILGDDRALLFRQWKSGDVLVNGFMSIPEPSSGAKEVVPEIVFVPLLAFDRHGGRLGYGKGHYDRTLEELRKSGRVEAVGIAYDFQEIPEVPCDQHDQRLDWILTPAGLRKLGV